MINWTLYRQGIKSTYKILLVFLVVLAMYFSLIVSMFDPDTGNILEALAASMPELMSMFGMNAATATLTGFLSNYLYGFLMVVLPMIFSIILSVRLVARLTDRGSMAYLLASPNRRSKVALTQLLVLLSELLFLILFCTGLGILCSELMFPGQLDWEGFLLLNLGAFCLHLAVAGICFFASCISNDTRLALSIGAGVPVGFYLIKMLANMGGYLEPLRHATLFSLFDPEGLIARAPSALGMLAVLAGVGIVLNALGVVWFSKRDLPL